MRNKISGAVQKITNAEKDYWASTHFAKSLTFEEVQPAPRVSTPVEAKPVKTRKTRKRKTKTTVGEKPSGDES